MVLEEAKEDNGSNVSMDEEERKYIILSTFKKYFDSIQGQVNRLTKNSNVQYNVEFDFPKPVRLKKGYDIHLVAKIRRKKNDP